MLSSGLGPRSSSQSSSSSSTLSKSCHQVSGHGKAPIAQSHQRQLSLKADEIQERSVDVKVDLKQNSIFTTFVMMILRLIKNKTLLNVVEPTLENTSLEVGFASDINLSESGWCWIWLFKIWEAQWRDVWSRCFWESCSSGSSSTRSACSSSPSWGRRWTSSFWPEST